MDTGRKEGNFVGMFFLLKKKQNLIGVFGTMYAFNTPGFIAESWLM